MTQLDPIIRAARLDDVAGVLRVKAALPLGGAGAQGFLLGSSPETYALYTRIADFLVLELDGSIQGFAIAFPDAVVRSSDLWAKRHAVAWTGFDLRTAETTTLSYIEQLAVLSDAATRYLAPALALALIRRMAGRGASLALTTTVLAPLRNAAALPMLRLVGARQVGVIDETYPGVGQIVSAVHAFSLDEAFLSPVIRRADRTLQQCAS